MKTKRAVPANLSGLVLRFSTIAEVGSCVKIHARGCSSAKPARHCNIMDPVEQSDIDDLVERGFPINVCACVQEKKS